MQREPSRIFVRGPSGSSQHICISYTSSSRLPSRPSVLATPEETPASRCTQAKGKSRPSNAGRQRSPISAPADFSFLQDCQPAQQPLHAPPGWKETRSTLHPALVNFAGSVVFEGWGVSAETFALGINLKLRAKGWWCLVTRDMETNRGGPGPVGASTCVRIILCLSSQKPSVPSCSFMPYFQMRKFGLRVSMSCFQAPVGTRTPVLSSAQKSKQQSQEERRDSGREPLAQAPASEASSGLG